MNVLELMQRLRLMYDRVGNVPVVLLTHEPGTHRVLMHHGVEGGLLEVQAQGDIYFSLAPASVFEAAAPKDKLKPNLRLVREPPDEHR